MSKSTEKHDDYFENIQPLVDLKGPLELFENLEKVDMNAKAKPLLCPNCNSELDLDLITECFREYFSRKDS